MEIQEIVKLLAENGIVGGLLIFFVYWSSNQSAKREDRMGARLDSLEERMLNIIGDNTNQMEKSIHVIEENSKVIERLRVLLEDHVILHGKIP